MGALGKELFAFDKPYWLIPFAMFLGLFMPLPFWLVWKMCDPKTKLAKFLKYLNLPIILLYIGWCVFFLFLDANGMLNAMRRLPYSVNGELARECVPLLD